MTFLPPEKQTFPGAPVERQRGMQMDPADAEPDLVNHPPHYTEHPSGVECIEITEHMNFCLGNAIKYIWRAGLKDATTEGEIEDLKKAVWYLEREIERLEKALAPADHPQVRVSGVPYAVDQHALQKMRKSEENEHGL